MSDYNVSVGGAERASESDSRHPADGDPYTTAHTLTAEQREIMRHTPKQIEALDRAWERATARG